MPFLIPLVLNPLLLQSGGYLAGVGCALDVEITNSAGPVLIYAAAEKGQGCGFEP
jgi:hypothetical protein